MKKIKNQVANFDHYTLYSQTNISEMKKGIFILTMLALFGCQEKTTESFMTFGKALNYFGEIEEICNLDNGKLWGENLYGAIMFVDRTTRRVIANMPDEEGMLKPNTGVYTGNLPRDHIINNAPINYGGVLFALVPIPATEDEYRIKTAIIHSLFHKFQSKKGIGSRNYNTSNKDEKQARLWMKLEWNALRKAISGSDVERKLAVRDALIFRGANREFYPNYVIDENLFENYEGLATFTYTLFCSNSPAEYKKNIFEILNGVYAMQSYTRSYGFIHGALYATLLYDEGFDFKKIDRQNFDLGEAVRELYSIELPMLCRDVAGSIAINYDLSTINAEEDKRLIEMRERFNRQLSVFTESVVYFELESPYFDFEPERVQSLDTLGTLYNSIRISDNWGKLTVDKGGCLIANNFKTIRISAKGFKKERNRYHGDGWNLTLNNDWEMIVIGPNYYVRKLRP